MQLVRCQYICLLWKFIEFVHGVTRNLFKRINCIQNDLQSKYDQ